MKVLIIEDELFSAERLQNQLNRIDSDIKVLGILPSVAECLAWFKENPEPDLLFLDIHLEDANSFELFEKMNLGVPIIYTTAYADYALQAFKQNSVDYLLKPIVLEELQSAIEKYRQHFSPSEPEEAPTIKERFLVKQGSQYVSVAVSSIAYFKSEQKVNFIVTAENEKYIIDQSLDQVAQVVDPQVFFRISRSRLITIDSIKSIHSHFNGRLKLELNPPEEEEVFVSRERVLGFKAWLDR